MKKRYLALLLVAALSISGCSVSVKTTPEDASAESDKTEIADVSDTEKEDSTSEENNQEDDKLKESDAEDSTPEDSFEGDENCEECDTEDALVEDGNSDNADEEDASTADLKNYLKEMKQKHNQDAVDLKAKVGEYVRIDDDNLEFLEDPDSDYYGFEDDLTPGCSVWCAVNDYQLETEASSELAPQGSQMYYADNVTTGSKNSGWVEGAKGNGIGESITITKTYSVDCAKMVPDEECIFFYEMCIVNGLAKSEKSWKENGRVKALKFYFNDDYQGTIELEDTIKPQYVSLSGLNLGAHNNEKSVFKFVIDDVYPGDKYDDTAITGIEIAFDTPNH